MQNRRQIFFNTDARGIVLAMVAIHSLLKNADPGIPMTVFVAHEKSFLDAGCRERLAEIANRFPFAKLVFLDAGELMKRHSELFATELNSWSPVLWAFPLCTEILPADVHGNLVYLDIDMLVRKDLGPLFDLDLAGHGKIAAAVNESRREHRPYLVAAEWPESAGYAFNNATLVIDVDTYRSEGIPSKLLDWYRRHRDTAKCVDQDSQNAVFGDRTMRIPLKWNYADGWLERGMLKCRPWWSEWRVHSRREVLEAILDPAVIHYVGRRKPTGPTHRSERNRYRAEMRELGLVPDTGGITGAVEGVFFDCLHALLRACARLLLAVTK